MPNIQVISHSNYATKRWMRYTNYNFAAADALSPLVVQELPKAMLSMPIGFILAEDGTYKPVSIQGLEPGKNLFVALDGRWVGGYIPVAYRCYPFVIANTEDGQQVLCYNEDSGLLSDTEGELFFGEDEQPSKATIEVLNVLSQVVVNRVVTEKACAVLQKHNLIQPWLIKLQTPNGEKTVEGLFRMDEAAMNKLSAEAFLELRDTGALTLAYCQLLSMQHLPLLGQLADAHAKAAAPLPTKGKDIDLSFLSDGDIFKF